MPQNVCRICSHKLKSFYKFIQQVQESSKMLMNTINKQFDCLQETTIDLPQKEANLVYEGKVHNIKFESDDEEFHDFSKDNLNIDECSVDLQSFDKELHIENNVINKNEVEIHENIVNILNPNVNTTNVVLDNNITSSNIESAIKYETILKCIICDFIAKTIATLNYHYRSKHGSDEEKLKCKFCTKRYVQKRDLLWHVKRNHNELIKSLKKEREGNKKKR